MAKPTIQGLDFDRTIDPKKFIAFPSKAEVTSDRTVLKNGAKRYFISVKRPYTETIGDDVIDRQVSVHAVVTLIPGTAGNAAQLLAAQELACILYDNDKFITTRLESGLPLFADGDIHILTMGHT